MELGFTLAHWCGSPECEASIKEETKAAMRCIPLDLAAVGASTTSASGVCIYSSKPAKEKAVFARAY